MREWLRIIVSILFNILLVISAFQGRYDAASFAALMLILLEVEEMNRIKNESRT